MNNKISNGMKKDLLNTLKILTAAIILSFSISAVYAQWAPPTQAPPGGNVDAPINVGATAQVKSGGLSVGAFLANNAQFNGNVTASGNVTANDVSAGSGAFSDGVTANSLSASSGTFSGNLGVGTGSPTQELEVVGNVSANVYYDRNDTSFYSNPGATSNFNLISSNAVTASQVNATAIVPGSIVMGGTTKSSWSGLVVGGGRDENASFGENCKSWGTAICDDDRVVCPGGSTKHHFNETPDGPGFAESSGSICVTD